MESRLGKLLGRYEIVSEIGRGSMGIVYKARDPKIDRFVAIKTISLDGHTPEEQRHFRERFFVEAKAAGRLNHPGIVTVFDVGEEPETSDPYIVMEYIEGQTLRDLLAQGSESRPIEDTLRMTQELAEALDYAHALGVVHRDIKPANILVTKEGQAKIGDFGIAQLDVSHMTLLGRVLGTPAYMSPEQLEGKKVDGRSDLFSLGAILYSLVTGFSPFQGNSTATVCFKVANRDPLPASALTPELPAELDAVIARALAKDPAERYQRGTEFARDLRALRDLGSNGSKGTLWFSESDERPTWLDCVAKIESPAATSAVKESLDSPTPTVEIKSQNSRSMFFSPSMLTTIAVSLFMLVIVPSTLAWRYHRILAAQRQEEASAVASIVKRAASGAESANLRSGNMGSASKSANKGSVLSPSGSAARHGAPDGSRAATKANAKASGHDHLAKDAQANSGGISDGFAASRAVLEANNHDRKPGSQAKSADNSLSAPELIQATTQVSVAAAAIADSNLQIRIESRFSDATLSIWIDNRLAYEHPLRDGHKRKLILLGGGTKETVTIPLVAGQHQLRVAVESVTEQYAQSQTTSGEFFSGGDKILTINFDKHSKEMRVALQ